MNILVVNQTHPAVAHISSVRAWRFAQELSRIGHRVVQITGPVPSEMTSATIAQHDGSQPLVIPCQSRPHDCRSRNPVLRKLKTAFNLLRNGGADATWCKDAVRQAVEAMPEFRPDVVWCTFGQGEALFASRRIAQACKCPWVLDLKDNWEAFIPFGLRKLMALRTSGWSLLTSNAEFNAGMGEKWHGGSAHVIYSGVDESFHPTGMKKQGDGKFIINLVGSVYSEERLGQFFLGLAAWLAALPEQKRNSVALRYLGGDLCRVQTVANKVIHQATFQAYGHVPVTQFAQYCLEASVNTYISNDHGFHHKLLELLTTGKPVIAFPEESRESKRLAIDFGANFRVVSSTQELEAILTELHSAQAGDVEDGSLPSVPSSYSWSEQARLLEGVLLAAAREHRP